MELSCEIKLNIHKRKKFVEGNEEEKIKETRGKGGANGGTRGQPGQFLPTIEDSISICCAGVMRK